jgi:hypothetical protein
MNNFKGVSFRPVNMRKTDFFEDWVHLDPEDIIGVSKVLVTQTYAPFDSGELVSNMLPSGIAYWIDETVFKGKGLHVKTKYLLHKIAFYDWIGYPGGIERKEARIKLSISQPIPDVFLDSFLKQDEELELKVKDINSNLPSLESFRSKKHEQVFRATKYNSLENLSKKL